MKISLIQSSIEWLNPATNRAAAEEWIAQSEGSALVLLSEMFLTGFCPTPKDSSTGWEQSLEWMVQMAQKYKMAIGGSIAVKQGEEYYNRLFVVEKCGKVNKYDKRHLFTFANEHHNYTAGTERVIITIEGVRILLLICYDLRFPVWIRSRGDYDVIACVANWPTPRRFAWDTLLRARAIENISYLCGVNIIGSDPMCEYSGGTAAIDFHGNTIDSVSDNQSGVASIDIDLEALEQFRAKFPALDDADNFKII